MIDAARTFVDIPDMVPSMPRRPSICPAGDCFDVIHQAVACTVSIAMQRGNGNHLTAGRRGV